jgi:hypothetical protein
MKKLILSKRHFTTFHKVRSSKFFRLLSVKGTILSAILFFFLLASCKKSISDDIPQHITSDKVERFLALPANPDPQIVRIINELKIRESKNHFLENIALESGFPKWEYAQLEGISISIQESIKNLSQSSSTIKKLGTHPDTTVIIPLVLDSNKYVNSFLIASLSDTVKLHLVKGVDYAKYGYESGNNTITAKSIAMKIMAFDNKIFQTKKFNIKHDVLAKSLGKRIENSTFNIVFDSTSNNNLKKFLLSTEICFTYTTTTSYNYCTTPDYCRNGCDNCPNYCTKTTVESGQFCYSYQSFMFSDNMGGFDSGSPGSGGGDGLGWEPGFISGSTNELFPNFDLFGDFIDNYTDYIDDTSPVTFNTNQDVWPTISNVLSNSQFVEYNKLNCLDLAISQISITGVKDLFYSSAFKVFDQNGGPYPTVTQNGVNYIVSKLKLGIPVIAGVDYKPGTPSSKNLDGKTDHFIVIVGSGSDGAGNYFTFFDNATNLVSKGAKESNKLYYNSVTGIIKGRTGCTYDNGKPLPPYTVTQIRKNK